MSLLGSAVLVNWGGIKPDKEEDYNQWHSKEHMPERISFARISYEVIGLWELKVLILITNIL